MLKKIGRNDPCWCGSGKKYKDCHLALDEKINSYKLKGWKIPPKKIIKRPDQIDGIRESGLVNIAVLDYVAENIHAGMSTEDIDRLVAEKTKELGGIAAPLNYEGFPKSVCTSINDAVCHGIPNEEEILQDGDIINVDVSTIYKGYFSDSSRMFCIGEVDDVSKKLVEDTLKAVQLGLSEVRPFNRLGNVGAVINEFAQSQGYKVVRDIGGHGVGLEFHEDPFVSYVTRRDTGMLLVPGMVFTIEPMINLGTDEIFIDSDNDWTVYTEVPKRHFIIVDFPAPFSPISPIMVPGLTFMLICFRTLFLPNDLLMPLIDKIYLFLSSVIAALPFLSKEGYHC